MTVILIVVEALGTIPKETLGIGNQRKNQYHTDHCIVKIGQNTEKSLGDQRRLYVSQIHSSEIPPSKSGKKNSQGGIVIKENETRDKYLNLARGLKKL